VAAHKALLLAESEINRAELGREWNSVCQDASKLAREIRSVGSLASTGAAVLASGVMLRRALSGRNGPGRHNGHSSSWMKRLINGARAGISIWLALRQRVR
jgi:hypothetical protein